MKIWRKCITLLLISLFTLSSSVFANSGPMTVDESTPNGLYSVSETPVEVTQEILTFDFKGPEQSSYTPTGIVTADYTLYNPTDDTLSIEVGFPLRSSIKGITNSQHIIYNGQEMDSSIHITQSTSTSDMSFEEILTTFNNSEDYYQRLLDTPIERYQIKMPLDDLSENESIRVSFSQEDNPDAVVFFRGPRSYGKRGSHVYFNYDAYSRDDYFYVFGDSIGHINFEIVDEEKDNHSDDLIEGQAMDANDIEQTPLEATTFIDDLLSDIEQPQPFSDSDLVNLAFISSRYEDRLLHGESMFPLNEIAPSSYTPYLMMFTYTIDLEAKSENSMVVSYEMNGVMDQTETRYPLYRYDYYLNPASHWAAYNNLSIKIIPPEEAPYMTQSNINFETIDHQYEGHYDSLPSEVLSFTFNQEAEPSHLNRNHMYSLMFFLYRFMEVARFLVPLVVIIFIIRWVYKSRKLN